MRLSCVEGDPGFREDAHKFDVLLNGEKIELAIIADEEAGVVVVLDRSPASGRPYAIKLEDWSTTVARKVLRGDVLIMERQGKGGFSK